ncbi:MAG: hypothetical protein AAFX07_10445 [Pseudomonadota bacterium]
MPVNKETEFNFEICTTVEALHKRHADYDMILAVEDFINEASRHESAGFVRLLET